MDAPPPNVLKVIQVESQLGILLENVETEGMEFQWLHGPCPLQAVDRGTGANIRQVLEAHIARIAPGVRKLQALPGTFNTDPSCSDPAGANDVAEDELCASTAGDVPRLRTPCAGRIIHSSQGRGYRSVEQDITGVIAGGIICRNGGAAPALQYCIRYALMKQAHVHDALLLEQNGKLAHHRDVVVILLLPGEKEGKKRFAAFAAALAWRHPVAEDGHLRPWRCVDLQPPAVGHRFGMLPRAGCHRDLPSQSVVQ